MASPCRASLPFQKRQGRGGRRGCCPPTAPENQELAFRAAEPWPWPRPGARPALKGRPCRCRGTRGLSTVGPKAGGQQWAGRIPSRAEGRAGPSLRRKRSLRPEGGHGAPSVPSGGLELRDRFQSPLRKASPRARGRTGRGAAGGHGPPPRKGFG